MKGRGRLMEHMEYDMDRKNEKDGKNIEYNVVREEAAYNAKPYDGYTIEDYCAIPEDQSRTYRRRTLRYGISGDYTSEYFNEFKHSNRYLHQ